jgi:co-chaperonin GroES (HSP10)
MERDPINLKNQTSIAGGAVRGMACVQGDKELIAVGKNILVRVEIMGGKTEGGLYLPEGTQAERVFVLSIGSNVDVANAEGKKLEVGDEIVPTKLGMMSVYDPLKGEKKDIKIIGENDVVAIIGK